MSNEWSMPSADEFGKLLTSLFGTDVVVKDGKPVETGKTPTVVASFVQDDGSLGALWVCDIAFAARSGGCLTRVPSNMVEEGVKKNAVSENLMENAYEVANIGSRLFNDCGAPHVKLTNFEVTPPHELPDEVTAMLSEPGKRAEYEVEIQGYGTGFVSMLAA